jgi:23S rRNA (cytidine1920-2'-O)/16S rRNA (cytidine1409-2'-O)-methyltransferase
LRCKFYKYEVIEPSLDFLEKNNGIIIALIKPQFESVKKELKKGGVIDNPEIHRRICEDYRDWFTSRCKMKVIGITPSPIKGPKGNIEFLIYVKNSYR